MKRIIIFLSLVICLAAIEPNSGEIIIGLVCPLTGPHQAQGEYLEAGMNTALYYINGFNITELPFARTEGLPDFNYYRLTIIAQDDGNNETTAKQAVYDLVELDKACIIVGSVTSDISEYVAEACAEMSVPFICPMAVELDIMDDVRKWSFILTPDGHLMYSTLFDFLDYIDEEYRVRNLALLSIDDAWGSNASREIQKLAKEAGKTVDAAIDYYVPDSYDEIDLTSQLTQLAPYPSSVLIQTSYRPGVISLFKEMDGINMSPQAIIGNYGGYADTYLINAFGDKAEGVFVLDLFAPDLGWDKFLIREVRQVFEDSTDMELHTAAALGFTSVYVIADAVNRARSVGGTDIRNSLLETHLTGDQLILPWDGIRFDNRNRHNIYGKVVVSQVQEGRFRTVWPRELSKIEPSWKTSR